MTNVPADVPPPPPNRLHAAEEALSGLVVAGMMALPLVQAAWRGLAGSSLSGADTLVQHGTLLLTFLAALLCTRERSHLRFDTPLLSGRHGRLSRLLRLYAGAVTTGVLLVLAWAAWLLVAGERKAGTPLTGSIPVWVVQTVMPAALLAMALRTAWDGADRTTGRLLLALLAGLVPALGLLPAGGREWLLWPGALALTAALVAGAPIYALMGGLAAIAFFIDSAGPVSSLIDIPDAAYSIVTNPYLPAIPLFTAAGAVLAHGGTSRRLGAFFTALTGWLPGGVAIAAALLLGFFTTFTGASGVTILALGPLLLPLLIGSGYPRGYSLGLMTAAGSLGMLFPPCLPVILLAVTLQQPIDRLFMAGLLPGTLLVGLVAGHAMLVAKRSGVPRRPFDGRELRRTARAAVWELLLPVVVLSGIFGGFTTLVEAAALTLLYALLTSLLIHRDLGPGGLRSAIRRGVLLSGGILIIIGMAKGFTQYLVDGMIAERLADWVQAAVSDRLLFLLALNLLLLLVGAVMDIFSAIIVVVPLLAPLLPHFDVHPLHFGVIFLINLEVGYLTPPVGMNLFMAGYTFDTPLLKVYRAATVFILLWLAAVLATSYLPALSVWAAG